MVTGLAGFVDADIEISQMKHCLCSIYLFIYYLFMYLFLVTLFRVVFFIRSLPYVS